MTFRYYDTNFTSEEGFNEEMGIGYEEGLKEVMEYELSTVPSYAERHARAASCTCGVCDACLLTLVLQAISQE
jgi:hypothetical protein